MSGIHFETINIDGNKVVWDFDNAKEIIDNWYSDDCFLPANDDPVTSAVICSVNVDCSHGLDFCDFIIMLKTIDKLNVVF